MKANIDKTKLWYVVKTTVKGERKAADNLREAGFDQYLPTMRVEKWNKRTNTYRTTEHPLMLRYIFVGMPRQIQHFGLVRACDGVDDFLRFRYGPAADEFRPMQIPAFEVERIFIDEINMAFDDTRAARKRRGETLDREYPSGAEVMIQRLNHALNGIHARVVKTNGVDKVQISLGALGSPWVKTSDIVAA